ncbi:ABC transporter substrate-binding protein [Oricola sp.]|uniref:ABC transporter substrate-binding protein n=1 Tax=Oricola sp. TaxID=1979950 RepID=UPI0025D80BB8|nr:ABC transporter substrate-binding protein [Oricola sp.]MCI5075239.1 ABC transporter substrate-binding protein [Oricola sp.]
MSPMKARPTLRRLCAAPIAAMLATAVALAAAIPAQATTVKAVMGWNVATIDPHKTRSRVTATHAQMIYDQLFGLDTALYVKPQMVGDYQVSDDGMTYLFTLRDGLAFHDGRPVTATDVVASMERWMEMVRNGQTAAEQTESVTAIADNQIEWQLKRPFPFLLELLARPTQSPAVVMPADIAASREALEAGDMIGSGPFKFAADEWVPGAKVVYVKNEAYVPRSEPTDGFTGSKEPFVDRVEWLVMNDLQTAQAALINGEIDFMENPPFETFQVLEASGAITVRSLDDYGRQGVFLFNHAQPPFDNKYARQAVQWLVDQDKFLKVAVGREDLYQTCLTLWTCGSPYETHVNSDAIAGYDPEKAKELFAKAGYDGEKVVLLENVEEPPEDGAMLLLAQELRNIGVNVELLPLDWAGVVEHRRTEEGWSVYVNGARGPDGALPVLNNFGRTNCGSGTGFACNDEIAALRDDWVFSKTGDELKENAAKLQDMMNEEAIYVVFGQWTLPVAYRSDLTVQDAPMISTFFGMKKAE